MYPGLHTVTPLLAAVFLHVKALPSQTTHFPIVALPTLASKNQPSLQAVIGELKTTAFASNKVHVPALDG